MSWPLHSIGKFCRTGSGGTPSRSQQEYFEGNIPWIKSGDLRENTVKVANEFISEKAVRNSSAKIVPKGAILVAMYGATVGRMAILGIDAATNQAVCNVIPDEKLAFQKYVYYALLSKVPEFLQNAVGGAQPNISQGMIRDTKIPLPQLEEQKRIAAILDKADAIRRKRQQAIKLADEFLRAVFLDMFASNKVKSFEKLGGLVKIIGGGTPSKSKAEYWNGSIPWVSVKDFTSNFIVSAQDHITELGLKNSATNLIPKGTIILPTRMALGKVAISGCDMAINQDIKAIFLNTDAIIQVDYLIGFLETKSSYLESNGKGATVKGVTLDFLKDIDVPIPSKDEQTKYSNIRKKLLKMRSSYDSHLSNNFFEALSQKAFSGDL